MKTNTRPHANSHLNLSGIQIQTLINLLKRDDIVIAEDRKELDNSETMRQLQHNQDIRMILLNVA